MLFLEEVLSASLEDYLETIAHLIDEHRVARAKDIAKRLDVRASSVTSALQALAARKLINYAPYDVITLTSKGRGVAQDVIARHNALFDFMVKVLAIDSKEAEQSACALEHAISRNVLNRLIQFVKFSESCPELNISWDNNNGYFCGSCNSNEVCVGLKRGASNE